jgi:Haem-NO-binding
MKGIILNLLEEAVSQEFGADAWCDMVDVSGVSGVYTSLGSYPDEEVLALVDVASAALQMPVGDVLRWFGERTIPILATRFGALFSGHTTARSFVLSVNDIIHPEVRKLYTGAGCPHFHFTDSDDGRLIIGYQSPRRLCMLAEGFVLGASTHYGETAEIEHLACMHDGHPLCRLAVRWSK